MQNIQQYRIGDNGFPTVQEGSSYYNVSDIVTMSLFPVKTVNIYDHPDGNIIGTVSPPNSAGIVYSWIVGPDGSVWWMFDASQSNMPANTYGAYYIKQEPNAFNVNALQQQGVLTIQQEIAQQKDAQKTTLDKVLEVVKWAVIVFAGAIIVKGFIDKKTKL